MAYKMTTGDHNIVRNLRERSDIGKLLAGYSDETIAAAYRYWMQSDDYPNYDTFPDWCADINC